MTQQFDKQAVSASLVSLFQYLNGLDKAHLLVPYPYLDQDKRDHIDLVLGPVTAWYPDYEQAGQALKEVERKDGKAPKKVS